ncbi:MAG: LCP family protein [Bacillota bacterium]|jgi:LCP family protein required for cell wall assembly
MYREKDYNRGDDGKKSRPKVVKTPSVYGDARTQDAPQSHRRRSVRAVPRREEPAETGPSRGNRNFSFSEEDESGGERRKKIVVAVAVVVLFFGGLWIYTMGNLNSHPLPKDDASLGISADSRAGVTNILLFGVDARDDSDAGRSDAMMIVSVDLFSGEMKMISLLRDSKVPVEGHGETKLNHAYAYGGPELAVKTINQVYHTDIREFATVNFNQLAGIVDAVGGVTLDVDEAEREQINALIDEQFPGSPHLENSGTVTLDGNQAISYSRIRKIDSDNARTDRQQEVLNGIFASVRHMPPWGYPRFVHKFSAIVDTSISSFDVIRLTPMMIRGFEPERYTIPDIAYETDLKGYKDSDGLWYWHYDLDRAADRIHRIIYGD